MEEFELKGGDDFLKISFEEIYGFPDETSPLGGFDTKSILEIKSDGFGVQSTLWGTTSNIFEFYTQLAICNEVLAGSAHYHSYEGNLKFQVDYDNNGHVLVNGTFSKQSELANELIFEIISDQTYMQSSLKQLKVICDKYGDKSGVKRIK